MKRKVLFSLIWLLFVFVLSGCVVRTYPLTKERVDQDLTGNRGYLLGQAPAAAQSARPTTRTTQVVEIELRSPIKFERAPKAKIEKSAPVIEAEQDVMEEGNRGYLTQNLIPEPAGISAAPFEKYTVQKGDTLQKISKKFYGTTKKWNKIYEINKAALKTPDKIRPGQVLNIPAEGLKETKENLK